MTTLWQDVRYALRMMAKSPAFASVAIVSLAIGIGANTAIFSVANALLIRPLPLAASEELVGVQRHTSEGAGQEFSVSYPDYQYYRDHNEVFDGLACWGEASLSLGAGGHAEQAFGMIVSGNYFALLGIRPAQGRFFLPEEDRTPGAHPVVVLSYGLWQRRFGGDAGLVGQTVTLNGHPFTVIGVAPQNFTSTVPLFAPEVWVPTMTQQQVLPGGEMLSTRSAQWLRMFGRLRSGVTVARAQAEMSTLALQINAAHPEDNRGAEGEPLNATLLGVTLAPIGSFSTQERGVIVGFLGLLLAVVGLVLLIACANLSSLLLARALVRRKEIAVRLALGASRARIVRQLLTESVLLCLLSGALGVLFALWLTDLLLAFKPDVPLPLDLNFRLDWRVLGWTFGLSLVAGVAFGLVPALQASRRDVVSALKDDRSAGAYRRSRARDVFVAGQVAMALLLLVSGGLFVRAVMRAHAFFPGAQPEEVLTVTLDTQMLGYDAARRREFYDQLLERVEALPEVEGASLADGIPTGNGYMMTAFDIKGRDTMSGFNDVTPDYFQMMRIPLVRGRNFDASDRAGAPPVAIIDETLARRFFPGEDPVGQYVGFTPGPDADQVRREIIGVVRGGWDDVTTGKPHFFVYLPTAQPLMGDGPARMILHVRTRTAPADMFAAIRREVAALDPNMPLLNTVRLTEAIATALLPQRFVAAVAGGFGCVGLALAAVGIFGLINYSVTQRTHEIGVRMALGARGGDVLRLVLRQGLRLALAGIAAGLLAAFVVTRLLTSLLYGVSALDPLTFGAVSLLLLAVALLACYVPARRATKVDPMVALRYE